MQFESEIARPIRAKSVQKRSADGFIYFVTAKRSGRIKIGFARDVADRIATMQTGCPFDLRLIGRIAGSQNTERQLHYHFRDYRIRGEWFEATGDVKELAGVVGWMMNRPGYCYRLESDARVLARFIPILTVPTL